MNPPQLRSNGQLISCQGEKANQFSLKVWLLIDLPSSTPRSIDTAQIGADGLLLFCFVFMAESQEVKR